jgi:hypothetical protein
LFDAVGNFAAGRAHAGVVEDDYFSFFGESVDNSGIPVVDRAREVLKKTSGTPVFVTIVRYSRCVPLASTNFVGAVSRVAGAAATADSTTNTEASKARTVKSIFMEFSFEL